MWVAGIMQGLMWRAVNADGGPDLHLRRDGGGHAPVLPGPVGRRVVFLSGMFVMAYNVHRTIRAPKSAAAPALAPTV